MDWKERDETVFGCKWHDYLCRKSERTDKTAHGTYKWL